MLTQYADRSLQALVAGGSGYNGLSVARCSNIMKCINVKQLLKKCILNSLNIGRYDVVAFENTESPLEQFHSDLVSLRNILPDLRA
jgi:hypothetical protein